MKKALTAILALMLALSLFGCEKAENEATALSATTAPPPATQAATTAPPTEIDTEPDWSYYNTRAGEFVAAMVGGDFGAAADMFDATLKAELNATALQAKVWDLIVMRAGEFVAAHDIENMTVDGYFVCLASSRHERIGATLRIVFSADGAISGLFIEGYPSLEAFTDYPVVIGTEYPLYGILSIPNNAGGKVPAVVLVHGSGALDMDETAYAYKPFRDIAEYLASNGIAVLRYNKRMYMYGPQLTNSLGGGLTAMEETIEDAILATEMLKADPRISEVYLIGHSLAGMLAPRIHAEGGDFDGMISLAGSPRSLLDIIYDQRMASAEEMLEGAEQAEALKQLETYYDDLDALAKLSDDEAKEINISFYWSLYFFREMDAHPVSDYVDDIDIPFLVLQGDKDFQVYPDKDFVLWKEMFAGRENVTFKLYDGLNHFFMPSEGNSLAEYIEEYSTPSYFDIRVLRDIAEWIKAN